MGDKFHIGSCTKSMTATLAAIWVGRKKLAWDTTIAEVFSEMKASMHADYRGVTLEQLLSHRGGMPGKLTKDALWGRIWKNTRSMTPTEQRIFLVREVTKREPEAKPGGKYIYSNAGVATAGAMIEKIAGKSWEALMRAEIFEPLKMTSAGFGPPATPGKIDQPWGHLFENNKPKPIAPGPGADNPPAIGPAGTAHCSITDFAKYAAFHLKGARGKETFLPKGAFRKMHNPTRGRKYALGWNAVEREWGGGTVITHSGSNTMFFAVMWIAPKKDFAVVVACNMGGKRGATACDKAAWKLIQRFLLQSQESGNRRRGD
jgi:CubicO group peptidase (beta-lactamase class C family)